MLLRSPYFGASYADDGRRRMPSRLTAARLKCRDVAIVFAGRARSGFDDRDATAGTFRQLVIISYTCPAAVILTNYNRLVAHTMSRPIVEGHAAAQPAVPGQSTATWRHEEITSSPRKRPISHVGTSACSPTSHLLARDSRTECKALVRGFSNFHAEAAIGGDAPRRYHT